MRAPPPRTDAALRRLLRQTRAAWVIARKDATIYYLKPPVLISGVIFPLFFYLAFAAGRDMPAGAMVPGVVAMALFFTASAVGPLVTPWERQARTGNGWSPRRPRSARSSPGTPRRRWRSARCSRWCPS